MKLPYDPAVPLWCMYPHKTVIRKDTRTPMFIAAQFTIDGPRRQPRYPLTGEQTKESGTCIQWNIASAIKGKFCCINGRDLEIIILSEASQTEKDNII